MQYTMQAGLQYCTKYADLQELQRKAGGKRGAFLTTAPRNRLLGQFHDRQAAGVFARTTGDEPSETEAPSSITSTVTPRSAGERETRGAPLATAETRVDAEESSESSQ